MRLFRISSVIIAILLASVLISCNDTANNNVEDNLSSSLDLVKNGETAFTIIRPELYGNDANVDQMKAIRDSFKEKTGIRMDMDVDWVKIGQEPDPEKYEILIARTVLLRRGYTVRWLRGQDNQSACHIPLRVGLNRSPFCPRYPKARPSRTRNCIQSPS